MKKIIAALAVTCMAASSLHADFIRVWAGGGMWNSTISGDARGDGSGDVAFNIADDTGMGDSSNMYVWAMVKHPFPLIPNLRVEQTNYAVDGSKTKDFSFAGVDFTGKTKTELTLDQTDVILYYNLLDNTFWTTFDFGLGAKMISGDITMTGTVGASEETKSVSVDAPIPYGYLRARVQVPATGLAFEADTKHFALEDFAINDTRVKVDYDALSIPLLSLGIEAGYRMQTISFDTGSSSDPYLDIDMSGLFFGANLKF